MPASEHLDLPDYKSVDGVQMASKLVSDGPLLGRSAINVEYQFNVEYAPELFERKPFVEDGPFGWQPSQAEEHLAPLVPDE